MSEWPSKTDYLDYYNADYSVHGVVHNDGTARVQTDQLLTDNCLKIAKAMIVKLQEDIDEYEKAGQ